MRTIAQRFVSVLSPAPSEFAPDLLSIQSDPPAKLPRGVGYIVVALFAIALAWVTFGRLDIVAAAEGRLVPQGFLKIVQPAVGGVVRDILVREGQTVRAGEVLMRMDTTLAAADVHTLQTEYALRDLTLRRIDAELADAPLAPRDGDRPDLYAQIEAQHRARRLAYQDAIAQETALLAKAKADLAAARELQTKLTDTLPSYRRSAEAYEKLGRDGYAGSIVVQEKVRERIEKEQDLKAQTAAIEALKATIAQSDRRLAQITSNYRADLQKERVETESRRDRLKQELEKEQHKASLLELKAPQAGHRQGARDPHPRHGRVAGHGPHDARPARRAAAGAGDGPQRRRRLRARGTAGQAEARRVSVPEVRHGRRHGRPPRRGLDRHAVRPRRRPATATQAASRPRATRRSSPSTPRCSSATARN